MRRPYLDWLRGLGVLIMIEGHTLDAWTRLADRERDGYQFAILVAGIGAPIFLFLAGVAIALAAASRLRKGLTVPEVYRAALRRGAWIVALAFLFRLQAWVVSGGDFPQSLLKVDILNVMGLSMMAAALIWRVGRGSRSRAALFAGATAAIAMITPLVRSAGWLAALPDPVEWYVRPAPGSTTFALFPWAGFLTAGAALGTWLAQEADERRVNAAFLALGAAMAAAGYGASFLPALYEGATFWGSSPTFFFIRLGVVIALVPTAFALTRIWPGAALQAFGRASLFVYWIHVEMAYGVLSTPLHRGLSFETALVALAAFTVFLFGLVRLKAHLSARHERGPLGGGPSRMARGQSTEPGKSGRSPIGQLTRDFREKSM